LKGDLQSFLPTLTSGPAGQKSSSFDEAIERWGAIVPHLLAHPKMVIANPEGYLDEDHDLLSYAFRQCRWLFGP